MPCADDSGGSGANNGGSGANSGRSGGQNGAGPLGKKWRESSGGPVGERLGGPF
eukprot:CAMPEP_0119332836 /NCGR_PEP_ID=MMETSP1333-20130426/83712_1 /TAXON_ID=418940 /ORGANISM="Scyphosphaera apsteinii, Strain RCC1455" /LENGTH=53 /DNA_ID=CAMNT_0007342739 /DNA_START=831 /DNA_END=989 /DNA_ORIENTATION=+